MDEQKMNELYELAKENNHMLRTMRRNAMIGGIVKFIFWIIMLVVLPYVTWLYIQPYVEGALHTYQSVQGKANSITTGTNADVSQIQDLLKKITGGK